VSGHGKSEYWYVVRSDCNLVHSGACAHDGISLEDDRPAATL
jgi:hypothetical protein